MGNQASTIETIIDGFPEAVLLGQNNYLSTDLDKWSGRSKTEFYLKTEYLDSVHENIDDNDHQADLRQAAFHQRSRIHTTNFSLASNYRTGLRHKTETIVAVTVIPVVVLVNFIIFIILVSVVIVIIVIITQTNDRDYCIGDCTNTIFKYEFSFLVKQLDAT